jgi:predicted nucleic acid-binding protein
MGQAQGGWLDLSKEGSQRVVKALFDTNVLVDYLNAVPEAGTELQRYSEKAISIITWMEVMVGASDDLEAATRAFLNGFDVIPLDEAIAERAVNLRRNHRIKLPDAIIGATAQTNAMLLVTRNTKDFASDDPSVRMPYKL